MTDREAQEIVRMIESNWSFDLGPARMLWRAELIPYPPEIGTDSVAYLAKHQKFRPALEELIEVLRMLNRRLGEPVGEQRAELPPVFDAGKRGLEAPEWVWVWSWCRHQRQPRNFIFFPQQEPHVDASKAMTMKDYEALREEWIAAGSPKAEHPLPMAR